MTSSLCFYESVYKTCQQQPTELKLIIIFISILKPHIHAALHARWVLRYLKTAKYVQINETDKNLIHSKT